VLLVFGGTTEGRRCAEALAQHGRHFLYSTRSLVRMPDLAGMRTRHGALTGANLVALCRTDHVDAIIDAAHPFAERLHATIAEAATTLGLPVWRFERPSPKRLADPLIHYVPGFTDAVETLTRLDRSPLLALSGVQTIPALRPFWETRETFVRILDRPDSWAQAATAGFPRTHILAGPPESTAEMLAATIQRLGARVMLTKESGEPGGQSTKMAAASMTGTTLLIVARPALPPVFRCVADEAELLARIDAT
jgi:precorrin-6x reductase